MDEVKENDTKGDRREAKRRKRRKMRVTGAGVKRLQEILLRRARKAAGAGSLDR